MMRSRPRLGNRTMRSPPAGVLHQRMLCVTTPGTHLAAGRLTSMRAALCSWRGFASIRKAPRAPADQIDEVPELEIVPARRC